VGSQRPHRKSRKSPNSHNSPNSILDEIPVNIQAREERHAKLKEQNIPLVQISPRKWGERLSGILVAGRKRLLNDENDNPVVRVLLRRVAAVALGFLIIIPFISSYQLTQGAYIGVLDETSEGDWSNGSGDAATVDNPLNEVMTEDGFLLKPSISTTSGDRTGFKDIFVYTVESGDTLSSIADRFGLKKETIMAENNLWDANKLKVGSEVRILPVDGISVMVKKSDTLDKIAKAYKVDKDVIIKQNQLADGAIEEGMVLIIPGGKREEPVYVASTSAPTTSTAPSYVPSSEGPKAAGRLIWPVGPGCTVTQPYHRGHEAMDIANRNHAPIYAAAAGKVVRAQYGWNGGYGNVIIIDHGNGMQTLYGHNEKLYVEVGQYVDQGQTISWMGNSGNVRGPTGIHLHFEVRINGVKYNPMNYF
jgi:murein DD-endopeptidase MepM/ murein hydrolase activator NlpD